MTYHPAAREEARSIALHYEGIRAGLGLKFHDVLDAAVQDILTFPAGSASLGGKVRCRLLKQFPYAILYQVRQDQILIVTVKHHSRDDAYWRERLEPQ